MEKLRMTSPDLTAANIDKLAELFPNVVTETLDADGNPARAIDFDLLRQELSDHVVDGPQERYHLNWPGKRAAAFAANAPIAKTLRPVREESVDFDTTKNLFIEGDNLDALKLLQESYLGKVNLIYIDPPYNTGNDFIYNDDFAQKTAEYLEKSGQSDENGTRLIANTDTNGRFHSDWLSMMYPRLKLARNLLSQNGFICISIDDGEAAPLKAILDEVFGRKNFIATIVWQKRYVANVTAKYISDMHDFVHVYARDALQASVQKWALSDDQLSAYRNPDSDTRGPWRAQDLSASKPYQAGLFTITKNGRSFNPPPNRYWRCNEAQFLEWDADGRIWWGVDGTARPMLKSFLNEKDATTTPHTWWEYEFAGHNKEATLEMKELFGGASPFDTPKPVRLMSRIIEAFGGRDGIVMDFFAGSSTFAHATLKSNAENGTNLSYIQVQVPEGRKISDGSQLSEFSNISQLSRERIRRAGRKLLEESGKIDVGFRTLKVDTTNMADVLRTPDETDQQALAGLEASVKPGRTGEDLLFQVLLDWGLELTMPISVEKIEGREVFAVENDALIACFNDDVSPELVRGIAKREPLRAVFRDSAFLSDDARINAEQIFREISPSTDVKAI
ncbi:site-specific DNA-methyltransferase [Amycolatopsis sp. AA4]|uniref:site-specific DNA-methyltransferase n=1 Tax=Actinomycetes TaxID=1760 RepID=UPI0005693A84|nr:MULTISPECIES: site-specific DNA-methyltransferase [Actinomycetes]ATY14919.1 site-specific DNA-methyltransferase [Amycolatopsis sp. AA4]